MKRLPLLGDLEAEVMAIVWSSAPLTVKELAPRLTRERSYNTVQTTLDRLHRKSLLWREKRSHAFVYSARVNRVEYQRLLLSSVVGELGPSDREPVLAAFVEMAGDADRTNLARLESLIRAKRRAQRGR